MVKKSGWSGLKISFLGIKKVTKDGSYLGEIIMVYIGTTINLFVNPKMITNRQQLDIPMIFLTNAGSKIVDKVGEIPGSGQTRFHPEMIEIVLSLN